MTRNEDVWQCSECGQFQGRHDQFFDGKCEKCNEENRYRMNGTYICFDLRDKLPLRWSSDMQLAYFGSEDDALSGFTIDKDFFYALSVADCELEIQEEYKNLIDKHIASGLI